MINYKESNRYEKVDWVKSHRGKQYKRLSNILSMLAGQLPTNEFTKIYEYICDAWYICKDQTEKDKQKKEKKDVNNN